MKIEPCSDPENALEEDEEDQNSDHETGDEDYQPSQPAKKRRTVPPPKVVLQTKAKTEAVEGEESYMTRVESHAPAESRAERSARIEGFMTTVPEGTKAFEGGLRFGCTVCEFKARMKSRVATHVRRMHIPPGEFELRVVFLAETVKNCSDKTSSFWAQNMPVGFFRLGAPIFVHFFSPPSADYSCRVCGKKYNVKRDLKRHIRNHDVSLVCDVCGKRCVRNSRNLSQPIRIRYDVTPCFYKQSPESNQPSN